jgi:hypothetical protein
MIKIMARKKLHSVELKEGERKDLRQYLRKGKSSTRLLTRARTHLLADEGLDQVVIYPHS